MVPIVRVSTRASLQLSNRGANLGVNPLVANTLGARGTDSVFFAQFDSALGRLDQQAGHARRPVALCGARQLGARQCRSRRAARLVYGVGRPVAVPAARHVTAGKAIDTTIAHIGRPQLTFGSPGSIRRWRSRRTRSRAVPRADPPQPDPNGFGYSSVPFRRNFRYRMGDVELARSTGSCPARTMPPRCRPWSGCRRGEGFG